MRIAPNPVASVVSLSNLDKNGSYAAAVFAMDGRLLMTKTAVAGSAMMQIDLSELPRGLYRLSLSKNGAVEIMQSIIKD